MKIPVIGDIKTAQDYQWKIQADNSEILVDLSFIGDHINPDEISIVKRILNNIEALIQTSNKHIDHDFQARDSAVRDYLEYLVMSDNEGISNSEVIPGEELFEVKLALRAYSIYFLPDDPGYFCRVYYSASKAPYFDDYRIVVVYDSGLTMKRINFVS